MPYINICGARLPKTVLFVETRINIWPTTDDRDTRMLEA